MPATSRPLHWADFDALAIALTRAYPEVDPRGLTLEEIHDHVTRLPAFADDPAQHDPGQLETLRSLWWWGYGYDQTEA